MDWRSSCAKYSCKCASQAIAFKIGGTKVKLSYWTNSIAITVIHPYYERHGNKRKAPPDNQVRRRNSTTKPMAAIATKIKIFALGVCVHVMGVV